jgi:flagellar hook-associated protein 2
MSTAASSISSGITPVTLTGVSQYSSDYQNILNQAVQIASQPLTQLQNEDAAVLAQNTALGTLQTDATSLLTSLQTLSTDSANQAIGATSSNSAVLTATATGASTANTYTINSITTLATTASEDSVHSYADSTSTPVSSTGTLKLTVGSQNYTLTLSPNSLVGLRDAINSSGAPVTASILTTSNGNYLSVTANATGATTLQLIDDPSSAGNPSGTNTELLTHTNQGLNAEFSLNNIDVKQASNTVNSVIPGVTLQLLQTSSTPVTVALQSNPSQLSSDLQTFVSNYNTLEQALAAQQGASNGGLNGDTAVTQLQQTLRQITGFFTTSGTITNLGQLGVTFADSTGTATFDQSAFSALSAQQVSDGFNFINALTTGAGNFVAQVQAFTDPVSGIIQTEIQGNSTTDRDLQNQITTLTDRINTLQSTLQLQLANVDAQEAELQSQQSSVNASLVGLNYVLYGQNPTAS